MNSKKKSTGSDTSTKNTSLTRESTRSDKSNEIDNVATNKNVEKLGMFDKLESPTNFGEIKTKTTESISYNITNDASLSVPKKWTELLKENSSTNQSLVNENPDLKNTLMSKKWFERIIALIFDKRPVFNDHKQTILDDYEINSNVSCCMFILKSCITMGLTKKSVVNNFSTSAIDNFFQGKLPFSMLNEKITKESPELRNLLVKSFQFTVKMVIDDITICPIEDDDEFFETLKSYIGDWFIGKQTDPEFSKNILNNTNHLFSIYKDEKSVSLFLLIYIFKKKLNKFIFIFLKKSISSRTLSLQQIRSPIARLNSEVVKSTWSSTNMELLFMTNDDDERYSIQANHLTLRNITIQSSEPPLGYCIYNSDNIHIPYVNPFY